MRLIDADELITAFPCGESVRTESVRATIRNMPTVEVSEEELKGCDKVDKKFSEDAISRAKVIEIINNNKAYASRVEQKIAVKKLSSVIPQPKEGEWVKVGDSVQPICSKCGMSCSGIHRNADYSVVPTWNYCPNCGVLMEEVE